MDKFLESLLGMQKPLIPEKLVSGKTFMLLTLFCAVLILVTEEINTEILVGLSLVFSAIGLWYYTKEKPLNILGISVNSWVMSILICLLAFNMLPEASWVWIYCPPLAAAIAAIPEFMESKNKLKIPAPAARQKLVILFLGYLVISCWINFGLTIQEWLENDPSLMQRDFRDSAFVVKIDWEKLWMKKMDWELEIEKW
ncbi:MAG: DUF5357 family protein [Hormoscilla sp.]